MSDAWLASALITESTSEIDTTPEIDEVEFIVEQFYELLCSRLDSCLWWSGLDSRGCHRVAMCGCAEQPRGRIEQVQRMYAPPARRTDPVKGSQQSLILGSYIIGVKICVIVSVGPWP